MGLGDGTRMDGTSSLDLPTGTRKYSMAAPSAGDRAAKRERKTNDMIDRNLQRAMRNGTPQQRVAAGVAYQERSSRPGYQQGGGIQSAEGNRNRDGKTADNFTKEGLRLEGKENPAEVIAGQVDATKKPGIGTATADGGTNSKIGTSKADASGRPRVTGQFEPGSELDKAEKNLWSKDPKPDGIGSPDKDGNITMTMDFRDSDKNGVDDKEDWLKRNPDYFNTGKVGSAAPAGGTGAAPYTPIPGEKAVAPYTAIPTTKASVSAPSESVGQGAPAPATTPPVAPGGAGKGKPAVPEWQQKRTAALEALRGKFTKQDAANALAKETEPKGIDPKYQDSGLSPEDDAARAAFLEKITNENATENTVAKEDADYLEKAKAVSARATELTKQARENSDQEDYVASALRGEDPPEDQVLAKSTENKPSPTKEAAPQDPRLSQNLWDKASPAEKATLEALKDESYSNAWWKTSGATGRSTWTSDTSDLEAAKAYGKTPAEYHKMQEQAVQGELREAARQDMIKYSLARGVDLTPLASKDPEFLKQWDTAKQSHESSKRIANRQQESSQLVSSNDKPL